MLRQLDVKDPRPVAHPAKKRIFVVGDPPSAMPALKGAELEAKAVADRFAKRGWDVVREIRNDAGRRPINAGSIIQALLTSDPLIVHLAGHGVYDPDDRRKTGAVLGPHPDNPDEPALFTPALVKQMRLQPELVFINCCHLGRIEGTPAHLLAANLATGFIRAGVRAVVAAGWAVDDQAAETFASVFYDAILSGVPFGDAVRNARVRTHHDHPQTNTWAAYQCYGNPGYRLLADQDIRSQIGSPRFQDLLDPYEVEVELDNVISRLRASRKAKDRSAEDGARSALDALTNIAQARNWGNKCGVALGIARASGELQDFADAVRWYDRARETDDGRVCLKDFEQHANFLARHGGQLIKESVMSGDEGLKLEGAAFLDRAFEEIEKVLAYGETGERLCILGSACKRMVPLAKRGYRKLLTTMTEAYAKATTLVTKNVSYPMTNALTGILLLNGPSPDTEEKSSRKWHRSK
jgi:tetratricopeptide (TPR) repeat protein